MTTDTSVKYFDSSMSGAPALSNTAGTLISVLDACLVNGFGSVTLDSLVVAGNIATATYGMGHGLAMVGNTGPVVLIEGATPSGLNGEWRVTVTSASEFTFTTSGISNQTATGTITAKRSPAGFEKAYTATNKAAYRSLDIAGSRLYCWIDDTYGSYARIRGYEVMTDVDTGTGLFPTDVQISGGGYVYKANSAPNRAWTLYSDGRMIYFFCDSTNLSVWNGGLIFGDPDSYVTSDAFGCILISSTSTGGSLQLYSLGSTSASYIARKYTQTGGSIISARYSHGKTSDIGHAGQTYPAVADNRLHLWPIECWDTTENARGIMPGMWNPIHNNDTPLGLIIDDIPNLPGRTLKVQGIVRSCVIDITGPWR